MYNTFGHCDLIGLPVEADGDFLVRNEKKILTSCCRDPKEVGWGSLGVDYACESTGIYVMHVHFK